MGLGVWGRRVGDAAMLKNIRYALTIASTTQIVAYPTKIFVSDAETGA